MIFHSSNASQKPYVSGDRLCHDLFKYPVADLFDRRFQVKEVIDFEIPKANKVLLYKVSSPQGGTL